MEYKQTFEGLHVWKIAKSLYKEVYADFSHVRDFPFKDQILRATLSIGNNIAEGQERQRINENKMYNKDYIKFLYYAKGSCGEVRSMIWVAQDMTYIGQSRVQYYIKLLNEISSCLKNIIEYLAKKDASTITETTKQLNNNVAESKGSNNNVNIEQCNYVTPKANISIIVLFILAITSLLGLFAFQQVQTMIKVSSAITTQYQSQALAKAGLELGLVTANMTAIGFEQEHIGSGNATLQQNFTCARDGHDCSLSVDIVNRTRLFLTDDMDDMTSCISGKEIRLSEGESLVVPLFVDQRTIQTGDGSQRSFFSNDSSGYNILFLWNKDKQRDNGIFFEVSSPTTLTSGSFDLTMMFSPTLTEIETNDREIARQKTTQTVTGVLYTNAANVINDFLYSTTGQYAKDIMSGGKFIGKSLSIRSKVDMFGDENRRNFLILSYPTYCPLNAINSGDLLEIKTSRIAPSGWAAVDDPTLTGRYKKWTNCDCGMGLYDGEQNSCVAGSISGTSLIGPSRIDNVPKRQLAFCLEVRGNVLQGIGLATPYTRITSFGTYGSVGKKNQASLQALQRVDLPDRLFSTVIER